MIKGVCRPRRGLTLVEIIIVLIIVVIITVSFGASATMQVKRANRETVTNELSVMATNFTDAYYDLGNPVFRATPDSTKGELGETQFRSFLSTISNEYLNVQFDLDTLAAMGEDGFKVRIKEPRDVYEQEYACWFFTGDVGNRYVMVACGGDDGIISDSGYVNVPAGGTVNYSDDIVLIVKPKVAE